MSLKLFYGLINYIRGGKELVSHLTELFGYNLKLLRKSKNLTQEQLAEMINLNQRQLTRIETGVSFVSSKVLERLVIALNVDIKDLFNFKLKEIITNATEVAITVDNSPKNITINKNIEKMFDKIRKIANNDAYMNYINLAFDSLTSKESRNKLKNLIDGMNLIK